ncbi:MAG TPA: hypothetical protein DIW82_10760 [Corynebacterium nuruki]|uniref:DUF4194 domain-containing protein n=2 Tax=Corynebacterium nuruki TaxID=1032851 RepID=A0A3D4T1T7_9CORY|nr:hypothetical protein [Corynebacterium nuruki]
MENDPAACFAGDRGTLEPEVRRVLVKLLRGRFLLADHRADWKILLDNQQVIESRLHDLFIRLVVDTDRGVAYKQQVRSGEVEVPVLLKDRAYSRVETLVLVYLRSVRQRATTSGEQQVRVDREEVEDAALSFLPAGPNRAGAQKAVAGALDRLTTDHVIEEESEGRYLVSPIIEIVLSADRLAELAAWLREHTPATEPESTESPESTENTESAGSPETTDATDATDIEENDL